MKLSTVFVPVPASYFSVTLGLTGLGLCWRRAHLIWGFPPSIAEIILATASAVWAYLLLGYAGKWVWSREAALAEVRDPIQCCFIGLVGVAAMLVSIVALPYSRMLALFLMLPGAVFAVGFAIWRTGAMWGVERNDGATTAILYIPSVAGGFVSAISLAAMGWREWGQMAFGAALMSWLAIESVVLRRLYMGPAMPVALRPTMGIQLAPPAVGLVAYLSVSPDSLDIVSHVLLGYALLQTLVLLGRLRWVAQQAFSASYWGVTFGATALAQAALLMSSNGSSAPAAVLAPALFGMANFVVAYLAVGTVHSIFSNKLSPKLEVR